MKRLALASLLLASCSSPSAQEANTEVVRQVFEGWVRAAVSGDADKVFAMFSDPYKSNWLFDRLQAGDALIRHWRGELTGRPKTELDLWWGIAKKKGNGREDVLPESVLRQPSLGQLFKSYFLQEAGVVKLQLSRVTISQVFSDDSGVTVAIKNGQGATELYGLINEPDGWKIDNYRQPLNPGGLR